MCGNFKDFIMAQASLKKDGAYVYAGYFLRYLSLIILIPYYSRVLGPDSYGQVLAAMSLMGIVWLLVNYGFPPAGARTLAASKTREEINITFTRQIMGRFMILPLGVFIGVGGTFLSPVLAENPLLGIIATIMGLLKAFNLGWFFQGLRKFKYSVFIEALAYPLNVLFVLLLVKTPDDGVYALLSVASSTAICVTLSYFLAFRYATFCKQTIADGFSEIKDAAALFVQGVNTALMAAGSTYLLSLLSTSEQVGYFGAAERIISVGVAFFMPAAQILMPSIAHRAVHAPEEVTSLVKKGLAFEMAYGVCAMFGGIIVAPIILPLFLGADFVPSVTPFQIMACLFPFAAFSHAFGNYVLIPQKKEKWLLWAVLAGNIFNLGIAIYAASLWGAVGMAYARVAGEIAIAGTLLVIALRLKLLQPIFAKK